MQKLVWSDLYELGRFDSKQRFTPRKGSLAAQYISEGGYRTPSAAWPHSWSKPLLTAKYAKWLAAQQLEDNSCQDSPN